ncbi:MAG: hypothetical protein QE274_07930 [Verrucomicrobiaceae bacterium]|nr:hypothetical protein [Verrucomicrobiaceae bacterium]
MTLKPFALLLFCLALVSCAATDGIDAPPGYPTCQLIFAQGVLQPAIEGTQPVQPLKINGRTPSVLRADHNVFNVPAGPVSVSIQGFGSGTSASAAVQFDAKPNETYRFGHQPGATRQTKFVVIDSKGKVIGTSAQTLESRVTQAPIYTRTF